MVALFAIPLMLVLFYPLPSPLFPKKYATLLQSSDGQLLGARISSDGQWRFPPADSVPQKFEAAILLFEDEYFHYHPGINPVSLGRAVWQNIRSGKIVSGGSTLTMQTVRMALENQERT
ncbi:MAG: transglycosylase domain-containing protein, partial [Imperialibacter sp.]